MAGEVMETVRTEHNNRARRLLTAQLDVIALRLQTEAEVPKASVTGDFLDVAQDVEHQELARLSASRLTQRAKRLRIALTRVSDGEYGVCSEWRVDPPEAASRRSRREHMRGLPGAPRTRRSRRLSSPRDSSR